MTADQFFRQIKKMQQQIQYLYSHGGAGGGSISVAFTTSIPFDNMVTEIAPTNVTGALTFTPNTTGAKAGFGAILRLTANGTNTPNLSAFSNISGIWDNTNGTVNQLLFYFDGVDYCVSINQIVSVTTTTTTTAASTTTTTTTTSGTLTIATASWDSRFDTADTTIHPSGALVDAGGGLANRLKDLIHNLDTSHDFSQPTGGSQPTIVTSGINGQKSILVDAGKYFIQTISTYTGDLTTFCVFQPKTAITTFAYYFAGSNSRLDFFHGNGTNFGGGAVAGIYTGNGSPTYLTTPVTLVVNTTYVACIRRINSTNTFSVFINAVKKMDTVVAGTNHLTWEGMYLGHPTDSSPCWIREGGTIFSALSDTDCIALSNEYKTRNGL